jgi:serine protease Do
MIMPVFRFDPNAADERPFGVGTVFRVDPWGTCATAFHVIEDLLTLDGGNLTLCGDVRIAALEIEGIVYGSPPIPEGAWRPLSGLYVEAGKTNPPLFHEKPKIQNLTELASLQISRSERPTPMPWLPVALSSQPPQPGEIVTGYGFAGLDVDPEGKGDDRPMTQYLYQSAGEVIEIMPADPKSTMPWPRFRVSAEWPSGMSGGPVLNALGNVIGVISRGWSGDADSTATHFSGWDVSRRAFPTIDPLNAGRFRGFAAIDDKDDVRFLSPHEEQATAYAASEKMTVRFVSFDPKTGSWMSS